MGNGNCFAPPHLSTVLAGSKHRCASSGDSTLPLGITAADARAILASCDRRCVIGRRDYAIIVLLLLLLLRLGLRRSEVASLDDIDGRNGALVVRGRGRAATCRPLRSRTRRGQAAQSLHVDPGVTGGALQAVMAQSLAGLANGMPTDTISHVTLQGFCYTALCVDVFSRRILGWRVMSSKSTPW